MTGNIRDGSAFDDDDDIVAIARSVEPHDFERIAPPPQVWNNILTELEVAVASQEATARRRAQRWLTSTRVLSAAAAIVLLVGVAVAAFALRGDDTSAQQLAAATMTDEGLPVATTQTAQARVVCIEQDCSVEVDLTALPDAGDADLELWVINGDVTDMHSLGLVQDSGSFPLPPGVLPDDFPIVDISIEPRDGEATHSGQSVLRGVFENS